MTAQNGFDPSQETSRLKPRLMMGGVAALALVAVIFISQGFDKTIEPTAEATTTPIIAEPDLFAEMESHYSLAGSQMELTLQRGDSLGPLLQKNGVTPNSAYEITKALSDVYDPRHLRAGQSLTVSFDNSPEPKVLAVTLKPNYDRTVIVSREGEAFAARDLTVTFPSEMVEVSGRIENSLYLDAGRLGAPDKVIVQFSHIYEHSVDFQRDIQPGDEFVLTFELYRDSRGNPLKAGDLVYASFAPQGKEMSYYLYAHQDGSENYYDADGKSAKRKLMRTPINGARLSSGYGRRKHPVLGYVKTHKGVDFAAPTGTPIMAAGVGTIEAAGRYGSFGKYVRIRHSDGYKTAYAHMSRIAVRKGQRVRQGQTIGYVGTTGRSTGPHLHYEVHKDGKAINPRSLSTLSGKPLPAAEKAAFEARKAEIDELRKTVPPAIAPTINVASADEEIIAP